MKILVLGGTVYLSRAVARDARDRGHDVTAAARGVSGRVPHGVRFVQVDRGRPDGLTALADESYDAVVDVARLPAQVGWALDALAERTRHWSFVSTCSVYADHATPGLTADTAPLVDPAPLDSLDPDVELYGPSKVACERLVLDRVSAAFIARAGLIVGADDPNDRFGYWPLRLSAGGEVLAPGDPDEPVQYIDVRDLAAWIIDAAEAGTTGTYDAIRTPMPRGQFLVEIAEEFAAAVELTWVPQAFLTEHGVAPWAGPNSLGLWVPLPEYGGFLSHEPASSIAAGMRIRPLTETARDWYTWYTAQPEPPVLIAGLDRQKEAEVLAAWRAAGPA